jgi:type I restriction enzyme M protein
LILSLKYDVPWHGYDYDELINRDKASLDLFWLGNESLEESDCGEASGG